MKCITAFRRKTVSVLLWSVLAMPCLRAQVVRVMPIDIQKGLSERRIHVTIDPAYAGDTLKAFDGNNLTAYEIAGSDSLDVTLASDTPLKFEKSKIYLWTGASWSLEVADTLPDLLGATGSYAKIVNNKSANGFSTDSAMFAQQQGRLVRLRIKAAGSIYLGEWRLEGAITFVRFAILPLPIRMIPAAKMQLDLKLIDENNLVYSNLLPDLLSWTSSDPSVAWVDETGILNAVAIGSATVTVTNIARTLSGTSAVSVVSDFRSEKVKPVTVKVSLLLEDPTVLTPQGYQKIHQIFHWRDPLVLAGRLTQLFTEASDSVVKFQIVDTVVGSRLFTLMNGTYMTPSQYYQYLQEPGWTTLKAASDSGKLAFDYREAVKFYQYDTKRNNGVIDEVWVFAGPYLAMYESQLMGPTAFWWNSPPIRDGTALTKLLSVMGLNYERGVDQAFHSFGHRCESAMIQAYQDAQGKPWDPKSTTPTPWDLFTRIEKDVPGKAQVGNVHFPPNGTHDYDYGNTTLVKSFAENWFRYPALFDQNRMVNVSTWLYSSETYPSGDPLAEGQDHLGYLRWWYHHLPRYVGVTNGVLNNWWYYAIDYDAAVALAKSTPVLGVHNTETAGPFNFELSQNYPNPFNPSTTIKFSLPESADVTLRIFNVLGSEVSTLLHGHFQKGSHSIAWDARGMPSGVYFYRLGAGPTWRVGKMALIK